MKKLIFLFLLVSLNCGKNYAQSCSSMNLQLQSSLASVCTEMVMTMQHDQLNRPYLYVANKEAGLRIYDISNLAAPVLISTVPISLYDSLEVMNLSQDGTYLYLALGNTFNSSQNAGMAIVDVFNPFSPLVLDSWEMPNSGGGCGIVKVEGNTAYLGAMGHGLVLLDVTQKSNIQYLSTFVPDINFPPISNPDPSKINARGMEVKNNKVYLCYDAGGFRIINCSNKLQPFESGHYCNPALYIPLNRPRAYNNVVIDDSLAYVAVDYAGMEILNISDSSNITQLSWWNPYGAPNSNWFTSPIHTNEISYNKNCKRIFLASGKSDLHVIDVSNPALPDSCNFYGGVSNGIGTWGCSTFQNQIFLSYVCVPWPFIPFPSNWTGVKILSYDTCSITLTSEVKRQHDFQIFPIPSNGKISLIWNGKERQESSFELYNTSGQRIYLHEGIGPKLQLELNFSSGLYYYVIKTEKGILENGKLLLEQP